MKVLAEPALVDPIAVAGVFRSCRIAGTKKKLGNYRPISSTATLCFNRPLLVLDALPPFVAFCFLFFDQARQKGPLLFFFSTIFRLFLGCEGARHLCFCILLRVLSTDSTNKMGLCICTHATPNAGFTECLVLYHIKIITRGKTQNISGCTTTLTTYDSTSISVGTL